MRRRGVGVGAAMRSTQERQQFQSVGSRMQEVHIAHVSQQLNVFKNNLENFARKHKGDIKKDPEFRRQFQIMCARIGVDPLASNKGFWSELLDVGDFYYELGVQIIDVCMSTRNANGGLIDIQELLALLHRRRGRNFQKVSEDDVRRSVQKLNKLGNGFSLVQLGQRCMVVTVPVELNQDQQQLLTVAEEFGGSFSKKVLTERLGWSTARSSTCLHRLLHEGMIWIDDQAADGERWYYVPSIALKSNV